MHQSRDVTRSRPRRNRQSIRVPTRHKANYATCHHQRADAQLEAQIAVWRPARSDKCNLTGIPPGHHGNQVIDHARGESGSAPGVTLSV